MEPCDWEDTIAYYHMHQHWEKQAHLLDELLLKLYLAVERRCETHNMAYHAVIGTNTVL